MNATIKNKLEEIYDLLSWAYGEADYDTDCRYHVSSALYKLRDILQMTDDEDEETNDTEDQVADYESKWHQISHARLRIGYYYLVLNKDKGFVSIAIYRGKVGKKRVFEFRNGAAVEGVTHYAWLPGKSTAV